jgi:hypothetical protein
VAGSHEHNDEPSGVGAPQVVNIVLESYIPVCAIFYNEVDTVTETTVRQNRNVGICHLNFQSQRYITFLITVNGYNN